MMDANPEIVCRWCRRVRPGTKRYPVLYLGGFLCIIHHGWIDRLVMCPACMRVYLLEKLPNAVILSDFLFPVVVVWWIAQFVSVSGIRLVERQLGGVGISRGDIRRRRFGVGHTTR